MKAWLCTLLLLETFVFVVQQQIDGGLSENEISQQISNEDRRQNPPQTDSLREEASPDSKQYCNLSFFDIYTALTELTATVTEQKAEIRALETRLSAAEKTDEQQTLVLEDLNKTNEDRKIAFSASLMDSGQETIGPFTNDITLIFKNVFTNIGNAYNPITGIFTAPLKGAYMFTFSAFGMAKASNPSAVSIVKNGVPVIIAYGQQDQYTVNSSRGVVLMLEVGDVVYTVLWAGDQLYDNGWNRHITFSGYLLFSL